MRRLNSCFTVSLVVIAATLCPTYLAFANGEVTPSDTLWRYQERYLNWHLLKSAWSIYTGNPSLKVAICDGAFSHWNDDFDDARFFRKVGGIGVYHGTKVASILGAASDNTLLMTGGGMCQQK